MNTQGYVGILPTSVTQLKDAGLATISAAFNTAVSTGSVPIAPLQIDGGGKYTIPVAKALVGGPRYTGGVLLDEAPAALGGAIATAVGTRRFVVGPAIQHVTTGNYLVAILFTI